MSQDLKEINITAIEAIYDAPVGQDEFQELGALVLHELMVDHINDDWPLMKDIRSLMQEKGEELTYKNICEYIRSLPYTVVLSVLQGHQVNLSDLNL